MMDGLLQGPDFSIRLIRFLAFTRSIRVNLTDGLRNEDWANAQRRRPAVMRRLKSYVGSDWT